MANTYLTYTQQSPSTVEGQKFTLSMWVKKSKNGSTQGLWGNTYSNTHRGYIYFSDDDTLRYYDSAGTNYATTNKFRDSSGMYHIVVSVDTTLATSGDRIKMYKNGERITNFGTSTAPSQNDTMKLANTTNTPTMGRMVEAGTSYYFDGIISHAHLTQGYVYDATPFGETDSTTGEWKIKTSVTGVTYGTNGFWWLKDSIATTDHSTNSNTFSVGGGTLTKTEDCPSNVFATMNPLANVVAPVGLESGNNTVSMTNSKGGILSTLACTGGKYYAEMEIAAMPQDSRFHIGIMPHPVVNADDPINAGNDGIMLSGFNAVIYANSGSGSAVLNNFYGNATGRFSGAPILGCAVDLESATKTMAISINGAWVTGSNTTSTDFSNALKVDISTPVALEDDWFFGCGSGNSSGTTGVYNWNFGNGYFSTTAVTSAGTAGSTPGTFEYDVPSGYQPLSTKGLNA
mgnify:CR=1 FL=1